MIETILSSSVVAAAVAGAVTIILRLMDRKEKKDDRIEALVTAQKVTMVDRVRCLGNKYIEANEIKLEDKETLQEMYKAYKALGGNGHLDTVMHEVDRLHVVSDSVK